MASSGYTPLPSDPPPTYAAGAANSAFANAYADELNKDNTQTTVPPPMPPYTGMHGYYSYSLLNTSIPHLKVY